MKDHELALFPLDTVLFPGGMLALRIFETRYLDLIRDCGRHDRGFGVCLILDGSEAGVPATPAALGCEARIVDFSSTSDGLLGLSVQGARRFRVERTRVRDNGLVVADVRWLEEAPQSRPRPEHELLAMLLQRVLDRAGDPFDKVDKSCFDDAAWVAWRLAEWLPLENRERQRLLQEDDSHARLQFLVERLPDFQSE